MQHHIIFKNYNVNAFLFTCKQKRLNEIYQICDVKIRPLNNSKNLRLMIDYFYEIDNK